MWCTLFRSVLIVGGGILFGCHRDTPATMSSVIPTSPTLVAAQGLTGVSGKVYDTALRPLAGAKVEVLNGQAAGTVATTSADGTFGFTGRFDAESLFQATADGHAAGIAKLSEYCESCNPHYWVYFNLALPVPPANLAGNYTLTVLANDACTMLPPEARTRTYPIAVVAYTAQPTSANTTFRGIATEASLVTGLPWEGLWFYVAADYVQMYMGDLHGQPGVLDQTGPNSYLAFGGLGTATLGAPSISTMSMSFDGEIAHCELKPGVAALDANGRFTCAADQAVSRVSCPSRTHRIVLSR